MKTNSVAPLSANEPSRLAFMQRCVTTAKVTAKKAVSTHRRVKWPDMTTEAMYRYLQRVGEIRLRNGQVLSLSIYDDAVHVAEAVFHLHEEIDDFDLLVRMILDPTHNTHLPAHGLGAVIDWPETIKLLRETEADHEVIDLAHSRLQIRIRQCFTAESLITGELVWAERPVSHFISEHSAKQFNSRFAEKPAGYMRPARPSSDSDRYVIGLFSNHPERSRVVYVATAGIWPDGEIDHIDGNTLNDRPSNLRLATTAQNHANKRMAQGEVPFLKTCRSGNSFRARVVINGKRVTKCYKPPEKAAVWVDIASCLNSGRFASTNLEEGYLIGLLTSEQVRAHCQNIAVARALRVQFEYEGCNADGRPVAPELLNELERADAVVSQTSGELQNIEGLFSIADLADVFEALGMPMPAISEWTSRSEVTDDE